MKKEKNTEKILSLIGLARKAGKVVFGEEIIKKELLRNKVKLILLANDASFNTQKNYFSMAENNKIEICLFALKEDLAKAIGKDCCAAVAITDKGFAKKISEDIIIEKGRNVNDRERTEVPGT